MVGDQSDLTGAGCKYAGETFSGTVVQTTDTLVVSVIAVLASLIASRRPISPRSQLRRCKVSRPLAAARSIQCPRRKDLTRLRSRLDAAADCSSGRIASSRVSHETRLPLSTVELLANPSSSCIFFRGLPKSPW